MKLRIKVVQISRTFTVEVTDATVTVETLKRQISEWINLELGLEQVEYNLSLNGKQPFPADSDMKTLCELGIVPGDMMYVVGIPKSQLQKRDEHNAVEATPTIESAQSVGEANNLHASSAMEVAAVASLDSRERICVNRYLAEPLLVCESTADAIPESLGGALAELAEQENSKLETPFDLVMVVMHILMLESGFVPLESNVKVADVEDRFNVRTVARFRSLATLQWKGMGMYKLEYSAASCSHAVVTLVAVPMGKVLIVHGTSPSLGSTKTVQLDPKDFIREQFSPVMAQCFCNLPQLSTKFKNAVAYPLLTSVLQANAAYVPNSWMSLPPELKLKLLSYLDVVAVVRLGQTCQEMLSLANEPCIWKKLLLRDYPRSAMKMMDDKPASPDWKAEYRKCYEEQRIMKRRMMENEFSMVLSPMPSPWNDLGPGYPDDPIRSNLIDPLNPLRPRRSDPTPRLFFPAPYFHLRF